MGQVWRGVDVLLGRPVAVKVLRSEYTGDPTFLARFRAEAQHAASLSHPNIACVFDYGEVVAGDGSGETLPYLGVELVGGWGGGGGSRGRRCCAARRRCRSPRACRSCGRRPPRWPRRTAAAWCT